MTAAAAKLVTVWGMLAKVEASYGAGATMTTTADGVLLSEEALAELSFLHDGAHAPAAGAGGFWLPDAPSGKSVKFSAKVEGRGSGTAYAAAMVPPDIHTLLRASGHSATITTTGGSESVVYAPITPPVTAATSAALTLYTRGQKWDVTGAFADVGFEIDAGGFMVFNFDVQGLVAAPTDVTLPSITYSAVQPPKAASLVCTIGGTTHVVRRIVFKKGAVISPRADAAASGAHAGFAFGRRSPTLTVTFETPALATQDIYADQLAGTARAIAITVGSTQYKRLKFAAANAVIMADGIKESADGAVALVEVTYRLAQSTPAADDDYSITAD